ncbi:protein MpRLK-Pelle_L-LEC20 [Marchantia polymorpha subsp. ruderalis]
MMGTPNLLLLALIGAGWCGVLVTCEFTLGTDASPFLCYGEGGLWCGGDANVGSNGVLNLTPDDRTKPQHHVRTVGMALVSSPIDMRGYLYGWKSFRTHFTFRIEPIHPPGDGLAFVMLGSKEMGTEGGNLGVYNRSGWQNVQTVAIEFDTYQNSDYEDINANHVGIDFQTARSNIARDASAGDISLAGGEVIHAWIDYSAVDEQLEVRIGLDGRKPRDLFLSYSVALSEIFSGPVYVGFAGSNSVFCYCHSFYSILYWTFETFWEFHPLHFLLGIISFVVLLVLVKFLHCDRSVSSSDYQSNNLPATATYKRLSDPPPVEDCPAIAPREFSFRKLQFVTDGFNHIHRETKSVLIYKGTLRMRIGPLWSS